MHRLQGEKKERRLRPSPSTGRKKEKAAHGCHQRHQIPRKGEENSVIGVVIVPIASRERGKGGKGGESRSGRHFSYSQARGGKRAELSAASIRRAGKLRREKGPALHLSFTPAGRKKRINPLHFSSWPSAATSQEGAGRRKKPPLSLSLPPFTVKREESKSPAWPGYCGSWRGHRTEEEGKGGRREKGR